MMRMDNKLEEYSEIKFLDKLGLSKEERDFIRNVMASRNPQLNDRLLPAYHIISEFYLAKQYEIASKASDKNSRKLNLLTGALVFFGACQLIATIIDLIK